MPAFIVCSLILSILVQNESPYLYLPESPVALAIGVLAMVAGIAGALLKKLSSAVWYDLLATGSLLTWFAYWRQVFNADAPMFYYFPLYYTLFTSAVALLFINRIEHFDYESVVLLRFVDKHMRFDTTAIVAFVLASLIITRHYMLYPIAMTLLVVRHMLTRCVEAYGK